MEYITGRHYNKKGIEKIITINKGTKLTEVDKILYKGNHPICFISSQDSFDYFARNDDEKGQERFDLSHKIVEKIQCLIYLYSKKHNEITSAFTEETTEEERINALAKLEDTETIAYNKVKLVIPNGVRKDSNILTYYFYNASIEQLETLDKALEVSEEELKEYRASK